MEKPIRVGVTAYNGGVVEPDIPADFDWFCIRTATAARSVVQ